jgi:hypothetical protein
LERELLYPTDKERSKKILHSGTPKQVKLEKMAIALKDPINKPFIVSCNAAYKPKAKKV